MAVLGNNPYVRPQDGSRNNTGVGITIPTYSPSTGTPVYMSGSTKGTYSAPGAVNSGLVGNTTQNRTITIANPSLPQSYYDQGWSIVSQRDATPPGATGLKQYEYMLTRSQVDPNMTLNSLLGEYVKSYNTGAQVNEQRYRDILGGYRDRYSQAMQTLQGLGTAQSADINQQYDALRSRTNSDLTSRGLGNTTIVGSMQRGVESERSKAQGQLQEALRREALNTQTTLSGDTLKFMADRKDSYPTLDQIGDIALAMGQFNRGGSGTGG
jgi:hypothetical protein